MNVRLLCLTVAVAAITTSCSQKQNADQDREIQQASPVEKKVASVEAQHSTAAERESSREGARDSGDGENETELQPHEDEVAEDCVAFLRATKVAAAPSASANCPTCPPEGTEVLRFQSMKTEGVFCSGSTCEVEVTIRAAFNPGSGESIGGGLTAWIPPEQRAEYLRGNTPAGEQVYPVKITYKRSGEAWRAIEFDRADPKSPSGS
jgi:hypothetical protein